MFLQDQLDRLNTLIKDLDDFIALHDYRYGKQPAENPTLPTGGRSASCLQSLPFMRIY